MICIVCGRDNPNYAVVCEQCGNFLPREEPGKKVKGLLDPLAKGRIRCSYCWSDNDEHDTVCRMCGMPLGFVPYADGKTAAPQDAEPSFDDRVFPDAADFDDERIPAEDDLYGRFDNSGTFWEEATKELTKEQPSFYEDPEVVNVPENVTPVANPVPKNKIRCRSCGKDNEKTATHCEFCGMKLPQPKKRRVDDADYQMFKDVRNSTIHCVACGTVVPWSTITCPICGLNPRVGGTPNESAQGPIEGFFSYFLKAGELTSREERIKKAEEQRKIEESKIRGSQILPPGARRCRSCWRINRAGTAVCVGCGAPLASVSQQTREEVLRRKAAAVMQQKECTCGYVNDPSVTVCARCGGIVKRKCPHCGYSNLPKVTICANCHARLGMPQKPKL